MTVLYDWCCSYPGSTVEVGDIFGREWFAWEKYFTITAVYHLDVGDPYDIFFTAEVEAGKSIANLTQYYKDTGGAPPTYTLTTYLTDVRIAGVITEDAVGLAGVSILDVSTDINGKYLATKTTSYTGTATPTRVGYTFTPETVEYNTLTQYAVDNYTAESLAPGAPTLVSPTPTGVIGITLDETPLKWAAGDPAGDTYNVDFRVSGAGWTEVSSAQEALLLAIVFGTLGYNTTYEWRVTAVNEYGDTTGDTWSFSTIVFDPPLPTGVTLDDDGIPTGTPTGENNMMTTRRLVAAARNKIFYEA